MNQAITTMGTAHPLLSNFIDGRFVETGRTFENRNPVNGELVNLVREADAAAVDDAVKAARRALKGPWEIAAVDGVDGVFVGPSDLSASMGHIGNPLHPEVQRAIETAAKRISDAGKVAGILTSVEADARRYIEWGYRFVAVGTDIGLLARNADALAAAFRKK